MIKCSHASQGINFDFFYVAQQTKKSIRGVSASLCGDDVGADNVCDDGSGGDADNSLVKMTTSTEACSGCNCIDQMEMDIV